MSLQKQRAREKKMKQKKTKWKKRRNRIMKRMKIEKGQLHPAWTMQRNLRKDQRRFDK